MNRFPKELITNYQRFKTSTFPQQAQSYEELSKGQRPETMIISCCDSRVDPESIFSAGPGELFVVRNVANLVPPFETQGAYHGVSAAIEFAALNLRIKHLVVMGHSGCGGIAAALDSTKTVQTAANFISRWMSILDEPKKKIQESSSCKHEHHQKLLEIEGVKHSLVNLRTFPCIKALEEKGRLQLHGAHFDILTGNLQVLDQETNEFVIV